MTQLLIIRHGLNDWIGDRLAGWTPGVHLNEEGHRQAQALAERLASLPIEAVYSSPLERAIETAEVIAAPYGLKVQVREGIGETQFGEWTGQSIEDLAKLDIWTAIQFHPSGVRFPGGETMREVQARAVAELEMIREAHPEATVAVVSHADVIKVAIAHYIGLPLDLFQRLVIQPGSLTILHCGKGIPRLIRLNDAGPLEPGKEAIHRNG